VQAVGYAAWRCKPAERAIEGVPRVLVRHGEVNEKIMREEQVTRAELIEALRHEGHSSLQNVRFAVLENDGSITFGMRAKT
jgi:uncharacterized membrane protein YcaP (DUF421 family)